MKYALRVEQIDQSHIEPYARLSAREYGPDAAICRPEHLKWKFLGNPDGPSTGIHLYSDETLVGRLVAWPRRFIHGGKSYVAANFVDLLVDRQHRGMNALMQLMSGLKQLSGFDLMLVIAPNPAGWAVWEKFARLPQCFDLDVAMAPLGPAEILHDRRLFPSRRAARIVDWPWRQILGATTSVGGWLSGCDVTEEWPEPSAVAALVETSSESPAAGDRSYAFLDWRFRRSPLWKYDLAFIYKARRLVGYLATRETEYDEYGCRFLVDVFGLPTLKRRDWAGAVQPLLAREARQGVEMAMLYGTARCGALSSALMPPFMRVPARVLPRRMTVFAKWLTEPAFELDREKLYLTPGDYDAI